MADESVPEFSEYRFRFPHHPLPCDCRDRPGRCLYCGGPVGEPPEREWIQITESKLTPRGRARWAAAVVLHDDGTWMVDKPPDARRHPIPRHFGCGYLKFQCEKFPETATDLIDQWAIQAFSAEAFGAGGPDDGDDDRDPP